MDENRILAFFTIFILSAAIVAPTITSNPIDENGKTVKLRILHYEEDGKIKKTIKRLPVDEYKNFLANISKIVKQNTISIKDKLNRELELLKQYDIVPQDTTLADLLAYSKIDDILGNLTPPDIVVEENFKAHFALLLVVGGGFGLGLPGQRIINGFTSFLAIVGGLAAVACYDWLENNTIYILISYMLPVLVGYIAGYIGLIIFAVEPGYFYSNLVMIGIAPYTFWFQIPSS
ncbi:MAG TPA: hypothetical protein ENI44_01635 [Thermoplasmatales archaeon]|nr:hypothetical protein [Thermoplasmatales archaeon]